MIMHHCVKQGSYLSFCRLSFLWRYLGFPLLVAIPVSTLLAP